MEIAEYVEINILPGIELNFTFGDQSAYADAANTNNKKTPSPPSDNC